MLQAARDEACLAVRLYNDPAEARSFEAFIVHMHLAWLYLFHAEFSRDGIDIRYRSKDNPRRFDKVDGEPKRWELAKCVTHRWPSEGAVRANLEFFIALRNKIEHRYTRHQTELALAVGGMSQALLLNFEEELTSKFGTQNSLAARLRFPIFIGTFTEDGERALVQLRSKLPKPLRQFIAESTADLPSTIRGDQRFDLRLRVLLQVATGGSNALAVEFTRYDDLTEEQKQAVAAIGAKGTVLVREQKRAVSNLGCFKPRQVVNEVAPRIPFIFNMSHLVAAYKSESVRPPNGSPTPHRTLEQFCTYDEPHGDYVYTSAYIEHLVSKLSTEEGFRSLTGMAPRPKQTEIALDAAS
ncbi:DUF3644 domain-containing protein [Antrihabitans sp. NCIMB 15449]|uniref:DUF3644 domain-containing protein n=1 Tax=Antrihabitans spumae TaxID=3373370 RepID=A0ABW7JIT3_9NOCA